MRRRPVVLLLIAIGLVALFVAVSGLLARVFSARRRRARGDHRARAGRGARRRERDERADPGLQRAARNCQARVAADAALLRRAGAVAILQLNPSAGFSLGSTLGTARVAWRAGSTLPVVQCVRVRRAGNALSGLRVELLEISARINTSADCPARY